MVSVYSVVASFWKRTLAYVASGYTNLAPLSNSSDNMHIIILSAVGLATYWCIVFALIAKSTLLAMRINSSKYELQSDLFLCLCLGKCPNIWDHMCLHNIHASEYPCMGNLQASDELREFFIVTDLTLYLCLQINCSGLWESVTGLPCISLSMFSCNR